MRNCRRFTARRPALCDRPIVLSCCVSFEFCFCAPLRSRSLRSSSRSGRAVRVRLRQPSRDHAGTRSPFPVDPSFCSGSPFTSPGILSNCALSLSFSQIQIYRSAYSLPRSPSLSPCPSLLSLFPHFCPLSGPLVLISSHSERVKLRFSSSALYIPESENYKKFSSKITVIRLLPHKRGSNRIDTPGTGSYFLG